MRADGFETAFIQFLFELLRFQAVGACQLDIFETEALHRIQRAGNIFLELIAQTVQLKADRSFESRPDAGRMLVRRDRGGRQTSRSEKTERIK